MKFVKKHSVLLLFTLIVIFYFASRFYNISSLPIFTDEAIYLRWAQIAKDDANWRFISLTDGKQPSFIWFTMISMRFIQDPLIAGRFVSIIAGFLTMLGLFFLGKELFKNKWMGIVSSFLYLLYPMALVYDRIALYDSLVGTFAVWSLYLAILLVRSLRLDTALLFGMVAGGGVLTKTNGFISIYLLPLSLFLFDWKKSGRIRRLVKWVELALIVTILTYGFYSILRLSPFFHIINDKNHLFVYSIKEWMMHPFANVISNISGLWDWLWRYMTISLIALILLSFYINRTFLKEKLFLFYWFLLPFIGLAVIGKTLYPRFIFSMTLTLIPLASFSLYFLFKKIKNKTLLGIIYIAALILPLSSDLGILTDFARAPIPFSDKDQYINGSFAGGGVKEAVTFFTQEAKTNKIFVGTEGTFGLMPYALELYLVNNRNIILSGFWPISEVPPTGALEASRKMPTYFVFYQPCPACPKEGDAPLSWPAHLVLRVKKGIGNTYLSVYKIN